MPWIKWVDDPIFLGNFAREVYESKDAMEIPVLEDNGNIIPFVKPVGKKTNDWNIGDIGELLCYSQDGTQYVYYKFEIVDSPFPPELRDI
jgi:hypothetical protein